jgi:hypothetical protein
MILVDPITLLHVDVAIVKRLGGREELDGSLRQVLLVVLHRIPYRPQDVSRR